MSRLDKLTSKKNMMSFFFCRENKNEIQKDTNHHIAVREVKKTK